jgi:hypothetical protein
MLVDGGKSVAALLTRWFRVSQFRMVPHVTRKRIFINFLRLFNGRKGIIPSWEDASLLVFIFGSLFKILQLLCSAITPPTPLQSTHPIEFCRMQIDNLFSYLDQIPRLSVFYLTRQNGIEFLYSLWGGISMRFRE